MSEERLSCLTSQPIYRNLYNIKLEMQTTKIVIAIDGFSSCGKSTMAKELARKIGYVYIDSGAMYRAVTLYCIDNDLFENDTVNESELQKVINTLQITFKINPESGKPETYLNGENVENEIRSMRVSDKVSQVSAIPFVREAMVAQQQALGKQKGVVMDGRDIGTTVFPDAELKIFVTASPETRAQRRLDELQKKGSNVSFEEVLDNVKKRDYNRSMYKFRNIKREQGAFIIIRRRLR